MQVSAVSQVLAAVLARSLLVDHHRSAEFGLVVNAPQPIEIHIAEDSIKFIKTSGFPCGFPS